MDIAFGSISSYPVGKYRLAPVVWGKETPVGKKIKTLIAGFPTDRSHKLSIAKGRIITPVRMQNVRFSESERKTVVHKAVAFCKTKHGFSGGGVFDREG